VLALLKAHHILHVSRIRVNLCSSLAANPMTALGPTQQPSTDDFSLGGQSGRAVKPPFTFIYCRDLERVELYCCYPPTSLETLYRRNPVVSVSAYLWSAATSVDEWYINKCNHY